MKKTLSLLLAMIMAIIGITIPAAQPESTKAVEWSIGYAKRCSAINIIRRKTINHFIKRIVLAPLALMLGAYSLTYVGEDGTEKESTFERFSDAKYSSLILKDAGMKPKVRKVGGPNESKEDVAKNSKMNFIKKVHLANGVVEYIPMPNCSLLRQIKKLGMKPFDVVIKIDAHANETDDEAFAKARAKVIHISSDKYVDEKGCAWTPLLASASDKRKGTFMCVREDLVDKIKPWLLCGLDQKRIVMVVSKYLVYLGLQTSASKTMEEAFGWSFDFNRVAVIPDLNGETQTAKDCWFADAANSIEMKKNHKEPLNVLDGMGIYFANGKINHTFSIRAGSWTKGCVTPVNRWKIKCYYAVKYGGCNPDNIEEITHWLRENPVMINTIDGPVNINDVDLIMTESMYKCKGLYKSVKEWAQANIENGYTFNVCVDEHKPRLKAMPYQQGQLLKGTSADALGLASHAQTVVSGWKKPENASAVLPGILGIIAKMYPVIMKTRYMSWLLQEMYTKERNHMIAGKVPAVGYSLFVMADPKVFIDWMLGLPIESQIPDDGCICTAIEDGREVVLTRNPDTDGCPICKNKNKGEFIAPNVIYINPFSWIPIWLRLDYDGDHVLVIIDKLVVSLFKKTKAIVGETPIVWVAPSGKKTLITKSAISEALVSSIAGGKTGIHSDNITKLMNISKEDREALEEEFGVDVITILHCIETKLVNVEIDSTKNAKEEAKANELATKMMAKLKKLTLPLFCRFAKASKSHPVDDDEHWSKRCAYSGSLLDIYSRTVAKRLPEVLEIEGLDDDVFDVYKLMIDPERGLAGYEGLCAKGVADPENPGYFMNEGVFNNIAFRQAKEWNLAIEADHATRREIQKAMKDAALEEINNYVESLGGDADGAFDVITRWLFCNTSKLSDGYFNVLARCYFNLYGDKLAKVLAKNLGLDQTEEEENEEEEEDAEN